MIWINFSKWVYKCGRLFYWKRIYRNGKWTPFCYVRVYHEAGRPEPNDAVGPDWKISVPDGFAGTASITYKGQELRVRALRLGLRAGTGEPARLELDIWPHSLEVLLNDPEVEIRPCE